jgi:pyrroline-5-carboxylate reductase
MLAIIGTGAMGEALLAGWVAAGWAPADMRAVDCDEKRLTHIKERYGVTSATVEEAAGADVVVVAVKPHLVAGVLTDLTPTLRPESLVVSIAAGVSLERLAAALPEGQPVVRVMPNTPSLVGKGVSGIAPGPSATPEQAKQVVELMEAVGIGVVLPEAQLHALTALSGSGPAYLFLVAEAMIEAGVHQGLSRDVATRLVAGTIAGAGAMLEQSGMSATELRERVTSPGGTTAAALRALEERGTRAALLAAVEACVQRSREL